MEPSPAAGITRQNSTLTKRGLRVGFTIILEFWNSEMGVSSVAAAPIPAAVAATGTDVATATLSAL